jgi:hypothetical protein
MLAENIKASPASLHEKKEKMENYNFILIKLHTGPKSHN